MHAFEFGHGPTRVLVGPGQVSMLSELVAAGGARRPLIVCGQTVARGEMLARVRAAIAACDAAVYDGVERHTLLSSVEQGAKVAVRHQADVLISVGGGSAIDTAKCIAVLLACQGNWEPHTIRYAERGDEERRPLPPNTLPHLAVPTTAGSASEIMPGAGCRTPQTGRKLLFRDGRLLPRAAVLDPEMAVFAGPTLTAASGMTAVARCVEALYSRDRQPLSEGLALQGLRLLSRSLPRSVGDPGDVQARADCQLGCLLSGMAVDNAMASLVHAIGHIFAGRYGLQHGLVHAILLAPAMRLLLPTLGDERHPVAHALGVATPGMDAEAAGTAASEVVAALLAASPLPQRLGALGIAESDLAAIAAATLQDHMIAYSPRPLTEHDVLGLFQAAW